MSSSSTAQRASLEKELSPAELIDEVKRRLAASPGLATRLQEPNLPAVREATGTILDQLAFVASQMARSAVMASARVGLKHPGLMGLEPIISELVSAGKAAGEAVSAVSEALRDISETLSEPLASRTLLRSFGTFQALRLQQNEEAAVQLTESILDEFERSSLREFRDALDAYARTLVGIRREVAVRREELPSPEIAETQDVEWLVLFSQAVEEAISRAATEGQARTALRSLMTHLDLGQDELGRLFGVSGETVRRWERGKSRISSGSEAAILAVDSAARRLLEIFRPGRLALVLRRKAELFEGETALEWILRGRVDEVVERYERTFLYQA